MRTSARKVARAMRVCGVTVAIVLGPASDGWTQVSRRDIPVATQPQQRFNSGQDIQPIFEGWQQNDDGSYNFLFGYLNRNYAARPYVPVGENNFFSPGEADRGQPAYFYPRTNRYQFEVRVPADFPSDAELIWEVTEQGSTQRAYGWLQAEWEIDVNTITSYFCIRRTHIYFAILTLAFGQIVYLIAFKWYDFTGGDNGLIGVPVPQWVLDPTFANYYKFVLVICLGSIYLLWRIVNSPFGKTLTAIRENPERADFVGINVRRYQLYAFMVAGAFSGLAGALMMFHERSVYPDLAHWTQSTQVLLMSLLGGVYTFFGPIVGSVLLLSMDADITQDYPEIWQLFLGSMLILILFGLPGGIMGFMQQRDVASTDDYATRMGKAVSEFSRKFWYFFGAMIFFTAFFGLLLTPGSWWISEEWEFALVDLRTCSLPAMPSTRPEASPESKAMSRLAWT